MIRQTKKGAAPPPTNLAPPPTLPPNLMKMMMMKMIMMPIIIMLMIVLIIPMIIVTPMKIRQTVMILIMLPGHFPGHSPICFPGNFGAPKPRTSQKRLSVKTWKTSLECLILVQMKATQRTFTANFKWYSSGPSQICLPWQLFIFST